MKRLLCALALLAGCYKTPQPPCAFLCGPSGECPVGYSCADDGQCRLIGSGAECEPLPSADALIIPDADIPDGFPDATEPLDAIPPDAADEPDAMDVVDAGEPDAAEVSDAG